MIPPSGKPLQNVSGAKSRRAGDPDKRQLQFVAKLLSSKQPKQALAECKKLAAQYPKSAVVQNLIGVALGNLGDIQNAAKHLIMAVRLDPKLVDAHSNLGNCLIQVGNYEKAAYAFKAVVDIDPKNSGGHYILGKTYRQVGEAENACIHLRKSIELDGRQTKVWNELGITLKSMGHKAEALDAFEKARELSPTSARVIKNLSSVKTVSADDPLFPAALELLKNPQLSTDDEKLIRFALGKMYDDVADYDQAFENFALANSLRKKTTGYVIENDRELFTTIRSKFTASALPAVQFDRTKAPTPIFIVGMPRSGTTLTEQILASHSRVSGGGELDTLQSLAQSILKSKGPVTAEQVEHVRKTYLQVLSKLGNDAGFVTDKMPLNFRWIGLIRAALPEAKIICMTRDPMAVGWSIFKKNFTSNGNTYANDLTDVGEYYRLFKDLMEFWKSDSPAPIYDLNYETLTSDQENQTAELLKFCGLDWEDACMNFHKSDREIKTASALQVRKAMYQGSSDVWKNYEHRLGDLRKALGEFGT